MLTKKHFSRFRESLVPLPNLVEGQINSYKWFLEKGINEVFSEFSTTKDYTEKKFLAAIQGVDLDGQSDKDRGQKEWEDMKARVFSGGQTKDSNDVLSLQGPNAQKVGFGIGMGLDYEDLTK